MVDVTLYSHGMGPNGWKVAFVLKALGLNYETKYLDFATKAQKSEEHVNLNPNGTQHSRALSPAVIQRKAVVNNVLTFHLDNRSNPHHC